MKRLTYRKKNELTTFAVLGFGILLELLFLNHFEAKAFPVKVANPNTIACSAPYILSH